MRRTLRKSAILRTTVLVAGKNGYEPDGEALPTGG
jgi:hypothetical protein